MHAALEHRENTLQNPDAVMEEYKRTGDLNLRNQLVLHYAPYVKAAIYSMRSLLYSNIPAETFLTKGFLRSSNVSNALTSPEAFGWILICIRLFAAG